ncbi:6868_t:CDS:2, partial [Funneliformis geosporum]
MSDDSEHLGFGIDEITLRITEKELREDMMINENFITSYEEPIYVEE